MRPHEQTSQDRQPATILVVDDDPAVLSSLGFLFEIEGFKVQLYPNGAALLRESVIPAVGCLVVDQRLPDITGLELIGVLRARRVEIPAFLITTSPAQSVLDEATLCSVIVVEKPLLTGALLEHVRHALGPASES